MPIQYINTGSSANAGNGDSIRLAFDKVNRNFSFVDTSIDALSNGFLNSLHIATTASIHNLTVTGTTHLNTVESATFLNQTYFENITVSNTSTLNLVTANDAKIDTLEVLTSLSVGSYQIAAINDYNDFSIIKNDATGLAVVLLNTNADSNSKLIVKDNISGGLVILHQNLTNLAGDFVPGENYIYGETPTDVIHIGAYSDIKFSASEAKYYDPLLPETPSMVIQSIDGTVHVYSSATFHSDVYGIAGAGANAGTLDRLTSQDLSKVVTLNNNGSLVPSADLAYDLGSTSSQWRSLYVGTSTIYLGGTALSVAGGNITIDGEPIQAGGNSLSNLTGVGTELVAGSEIEVALAKTVISNKVSNNLGGGGPSLTAQGIVEVDSGKAIVAHQIINTLDSETSLTSSNQIEVNSTSTRIGTQLTNTLGTSTVSAFNGWTFGTNGVLTAPGHILPDADLTYDLGSTSSQWRSIYVGTGTIFIGGVALGVSADNYVTVDGNPIITVNTSGNLTIQGDTNIVLGAVIVSDTAPAATTPGSQWFNTVEGRTYVATNGLWLDASPTQIPSPETYLDGLAIDGTVISTANVDSDAIVVDGGDNTKLTVSNNSITIQVPGSLTRPYWAAEFGGITTAVTTSSYTVGTGAFYDSLGNVYVLGGVLFGGGINDVDSLLLKYDTNGNLLWSRTWHDNSGNNCGAVNQAFAIDSNDRIYWLATDITSYGCWTGYMDTDGNLGLGGIAQGSLGFVGGYVSVVDIACDNSGNYYLAGRYSDGNGNDSPVVIKVDGNSGAPIWTGNIIPEDFESLPTDGQYRAVTVNPATGDVWAIGDYNDVGLRAMLSKWDINGTHQWTKELVTVTGDLASAVIYNGGYVYTIVNDDGDQKAVVSKFDTDGVLIWASYLAAGALDPIPPGGPGSYNTGAYDLSFDSAGNVYVTGTIPGPPVGAPQLWITKLDPTNGEMLYSRILATNEGLVVTDSSGFGTSTGHRVGDIYQDKIVVTAVTQSDIDDSTSTNEIRVMVAQLPIDGSVTGTFDNIDIVNINDIDSICSTGTYTVTTLVWSTGTSTAIYSTSSISVSYVTDVVGLTGETIALGSGTAGGSTTTNTWTFVNNNIILPPGGDILDSYGNSVLGVSSTTPLPSWITVVPGTEQLPTLNTDYGWDSQGAWTVNYTTLLGNAPGPEGTSYPFRTTFSIPNDTKSVTTVDFTHDIAGESSSDFGIGVFAAGTDPVWAWDGTSGNNGANRIGAQYNGPVPELHGKSGGYESGYELPSPGTYRARLTVEPTGPGIADITLETLNTSGTVLDTITYEETSFFGTNYKIGFASDEDDGSPKVYFKNLTINIDNGATVYTDTLMNGNSVGGSTTALGDRLTAGSNSVVLSSTGTLTLPNGGVISEIGGAFGGAIRLEPSGASSSTQALVIYPTAGGDGNHIHLTAGGGGTDLYLGDDDQYVKVDHSGTVVVGTLGANTSTWTFGTDGVLTLSTASVILGSGTDPNVYIETATTGTNNTWTFGSAGRMTFPTHTVPTTSHGAPGDKAGMLVFDSVGMYYCTSDFVGTSTEYNVTINSSQPTWLAFAKSSYPNALADFTVDNSTGWTVTYDGSTYNITSMDEYNGSYWRVYWAETITIVNADPAMITRLDAHIWVRQAWSSVGGWT